MKLSYMTWEQVQGADRDSIILLPVVSVKQHRLHLPLATDQLIMSSLVEEVEKELSEQVILCPMLLAGASYGCSEFAGSMIYSKETVSAFIEETIHSFIKHDFTKFYLLSPNKEDSEVYKLILKQIKNNDFYQNCCCISYEELVSDVVKKQLEGPLKEIGHADEFETSLMLHLHPELVLKDKIQDELLISQPLIKGLILNYNEISEWGVYGYPTFANAKKGEFFFDLMKKDLQKQLKAFHKGYILAES